MKFSTNGENGAVGMSREGKEVVFGGAKEQFGLYMGLVLDTLLERILPYRKI